MIVKEFDIEDFQNLLNFCELESKEKHPAAPNMWTEDWENNSHTLPFILTKTDRFFNNNGKFYLLIDNDKIVGCSGVYKSEYSEKLVIAGARTWLSRSYRNVQHLKNDFLPLQRDWAIEHKADVIALSFNKYNVSAIRLFRIGQKTGSRSPRHIFYKNYNELDFPVIIQYTPQWVIYENLNDYQFDWEMIRA